MMPPAGPPVTCPRCRRIFEAGFTLPNGTVVPGHQPDGPFCHPVFVTHRSRPRTAPIRPDPVTDEDREARAERAREQLRIARGAFPSWTARLHAAEGRRDRPRSLADEEI